jgi:hypothetical protein
MSVEQLKVDAIDAAQKYKARYKQSLDPNDLDLFQRFMDVYKHLDGINIGLFSQTENGPTVIYTDGDSSIVGNGVGGLSVPADYFRAGSTFKLSVHGNITSANNAQLAIRLKEGALTVSEIIITMVSTVDQDFDIDVNFVVRSIGGPGVAKLLTVGTFSYSKSSNANPEAFYFDSLEQTNFDTTVATTLDVTAEWLTSEAGNQLFTQSLNLYKIW